ncbi:Sec39 domain-containing protein [Lipomyces doorenjongii]|uniref:Sec39 domain-containing protein n=1 Tax=Lipomyces doorenjongii TaxID=383834 RepID=UPI0034CF432C
MDQSVPGPRSILLATYLASASKTDELRKLFGSSAWNTAATPSQALNVLLKFVPQTAEPSSYLSLVFDIAYSRLDDSDDSEGLADLLPDEIRLLDGDTATSVGDKLLSDGTASVDFYEGDPQLTIASWVFERIYSIDSSFGVLELIDAIVSADVSEPLPAAVLLWRDGVLRPLQLFYVSYPNAVDKELYHLREYTSTNPQLIIEHFLQYTTTKTINRDVAMIITPYLHYITTISADRIKPWNNFYEWLVITAATNFQIIIELVKNWNGPDGDSSALINYVSTIIASCYQCSEVRSEYFEAMHILQKRGSYVLNLADIIPVDDDDDRFIETQMVSYSDADSAFKFPECPLYQATQSNLYILDQLITSGAMISVYVPTSLQSIAKLRFFATHQAQLQFLLSVVRGNSKEYAYRDDSNWRTLRSGSRWLKNKSYVLSKLSDADIENAFLSALLDFGRISLVREIYIDPIQLPLEMEDIETHVLHSFRQHYDGASNCNATRGSLKTASQVLHLIYPSMLKTDKLEKAELLLKATHELSKYSLTLVQGVPLAPLQIRINNNPEQIISQLLQSNEKAYLQVDEMISITKNLVIGLDTALDALQGIEFRVIRMCVYAALAADDFSVAYEYCMNKLWSHANEINAFDQDLLWQVFFAAGRYVSPNAPSLSSSPGFQVTAQTQMMMLQLNNRIKYLRLQMELLSRALDICPERHMFEILNIWQDFELQVAQFTAR